MLTILLFSGFMAYLKDERDSYLWLQCPLCTSGAVQADALIYTIISGKIVAHLVTVATAFILCSAISAALSLRGLLKGERFTRIMEVRKRGDSFQPVFMCWSAGWKKQKSKAHSSAFSQIRQHYCKKSSRAKRKHQSCILSMVQRLAHTNHCGRV